MQCVRWKLAYHLRNSEAKPSKPWSKLVIFYKWICCLLVKTKIYLTASPQIPLAGFFYIQEQSH